jgi:CMP-N-acetylneuraminic acid synthetase
MEFCGKPLIAWSIEQAKASRYIDNVYVSSDDDEILGVSMGHGAITIKRPRELATNTSLSEAALLHALDYMDNPDIVVFLQATSPVRETKDIEDALTHFITRDVDSLFSVSPSQEENGSIYIFKSNEFRKYKSRKARCSMVYTMPWWKSWEIDCPKDVRVCEHNMELL